MIVKCKICGNKLDRNDAYKVSDGKINKYYCTKQEYLDSVNKQINRNKVFEQIDNIFGYKVTHTSLFKEISEIERVYTYEQIYLYLSENTQYLSNIMQKSFSSEYGKIRYFAVVIKNNLSGYKFKKEKDPKPLEVDIPKDNYKPRERRKTLIEYETEVGEKK